MKVKGYILCVCLALTAVAGYGQKTDRDYLRSGKQALSRNELVCQWRKVRHNRKAAGG